MQEGSQDDAVALKDSYSVQQHRLVCTACLDISALKHHNYTRAVNFLESHKFVTFQDYYRVSAAALCGYFCALPSYLAMHDLYVNPSAAAARMPPWSSIL